MPGAYNDPQFLSSVTDLGATNADMDSLLQQQLAINDVLKGKHMSFAGGMLPGFASGMGAAGRKAMIEKARQQQLAALLRQNQQPGTQGAGGNGPLSQGPLPPSVQTPPSVDLSSFPDQGLF